MVLLHFACAALLLALSSIGYGMAAMTIVQKRLIDLPIAFRFVTAYFLGQSLIVVVLAVLGLQGIFRFPVVVGFLVPGAIAAAFGIWRFRLAIRDSYARTMLTIHLAPTSWKILIFLAVSLYMYGLTSMGRVLDGDAAAFYLAAAKLLSSSGQLTPLPGYEGFSWVVMTGEIVQATLMLLGAPEMTARLYDWLNFFPMLISFYYVARVCELSRRASFLAVVMALTSSAAVCLWNGGKVDNFAIGPTFVGVWFAVASWRTIHRPTFIALSGLFCGFAVMAKISYIAVLLPGMLVLIVWEDLLDILKEFREKNSKAVLGRILRAGQSSLLFLLLFGIGLAPFLIKNHILFNAPLGSGVAMASSFWFSRETVIRIIATYPFALTYGRYWGQLGNLSPLVLAFLPFIAMLPRDQRRLRSPLMAVTISTLVAVVIWIALAPAMFFPRYLLATLLLFALPAAAVAANLSRRAGMLSAIVVAAVGITIIATPRHVDTRSGTFFPKRMFSYLKDGTETQRVLLSDPAGVVTLKVNATASSSDRVLLLISSRAWLSGDLLKTVSSTTEVSDATQFLTDGNAAFWKFMKDKNFKFLIADAPFKDRIAVILKAKPSDTTFCELSAHDGTVAYQIGGRC